MSDDEQDFIFYGTPIEREEDTSARKRKAVADAGQLRSLPAWKQDVRDEEGRRRFHGAFTGGFSAGYYNSVGTKEGWTPQTFTSSRKNRAEVKKQSIYSFLDDEDIKDMGGHALETSSQFDTFGFTAAEVARKQAEKEQQTRPSAIPGPVPDEIVLPAANSVGIKLLVKMGWRHGHSIKESNADSLYDSRREARKAFLAFSGNEGSSEPSKVESSKSDVGDTTEKYNDVVSSQSTPVYVLHPKQDLHGLGYDPFKHAPEFRDRKMLVDSRAKVRGSKAEISARSKLDSGKYAPGFGIGALEELDVEDEDIYTSGVDYARMEVEEDEPSRATSGSKLTLEYKKQGGLSGFKVASRSDYNVERFQPPVIPADFKPFHKFASPQETMDKFAELPPAEVPPPEDNSLRLLIDGFANLVARCGKLFEDLSREKNQANPLFSFLSGGGGHQYYARKLWEAKQKHVQERHVDTPSNQKMTAESRGRILGETPLGRSINGSTAAVAHKEVIHFPSNLSDNFTKPATTVDYSERAKPFKDDPAKQNRFEQFLKDKYQGGLRSACPGGVSTMSDKERARERLDFEAAVEAIEKGQWNEKAELPPGQQVLDLLGETDRFVPSTVEKNHISEVEGNMDVKAYPRREQFEWRPAPLLCRRFDLIDPFMGKPPPLPRARSKLDTLIFMPDSLPNMRTEDDLPKRNSLPPSHSQPQGSEKQLSREDPDDPDTDTRNVERPVDLYKAIFSDDSEDELENAGVSNVDNPEKKIEGVNTTLNRLIAGDFLESLGKELGLEVPPDRPQPVNKASSLTPSTGVPGGNIRTFSRDESTAVAETSNQHLVHEKPRGPLNIAGGGLASENDGPPQEESRDRTDDMKKDQSITPLRGEADGDLSDQKDYKLIAGEKEQRSRKHRSHSRHHRHSSSSDTDSSGHHRYYDRSKSRSDKGTSSKRKSRKHSDYRDHKRSRSPTRYSSREKDQDLSDDDKKGRRSRDKEKHSRKKHR